MLATVWAKVGECWGSWGALTCSQTDELAVGEDGREAAELDGVLDHDERVFVEQRRRREGVHQL